MQKPDVIIVCSKAMSGVGLVSCVLIPYTTQKRLFKWYGKKVELLIDFVHC